MKYKLTINYEYIRDMQEVYNELIEDGFLPDEAEKEIKSSLKELAERIDWCASNVFWGNYIRVVDVEEVENGEED